MNTKQQYHYQITTHGMIEQIYNDDIEIVDRIEPNFTSLDIPFFQDRIDGYYEDLIQYIHSALKEVVKEMKTPQMISLNRNLFVLQWEVITTKELTKKQQNALIKEIQGQCSDGWGEGFEQQEQLYKGNEYYIITWYRNSPDPSIVLV